MNAKSRKAVWVALAVVIVGALLFRFRGSFHLEQFSGAKLWGAIRGANYFLLLLSVVTIYSCYAVRALRWQKFQAHVGRAKFWNIYGMNLAGFSASLLLGRAGEPVRPILISRKDKIPLADAFGIYALERILDAACTAVLAAIALLLFKSGNHASVKETAANFEKAARTGGMWFSIFAALAISGLVYLRLQGSGVLSKRMEGWQAQGGWRSKVAGILLGFVRGVQTIKTVSDLIAAIFYSAVHWILVALVYYLIIQSFPGKLSTLTFADAMLVLVLTLLGSIVQLPGVGGGAQAMSIFAFTKLYGVEQEPAVAAAMVLWLVTFASCTLVGVPLLFREGWSLGDLRRMEDVKVEKEQAAGGGSKKIAAPIGRDLAAKSGGETGE